jgi:RNA polymerase sigma-70 factor (sigma-E family)
VSTMRQPDGMGDATTSQAAREAAVVALFDEHADRLLRLALLLLGERSVAEEVVQEAFVAAWRDWDAIREPEHADAWLRGVVVRLARRSIRRKMLERRHSLGAVALPVDTGVHDPAGRLDLQRAIALLPPRKRACVVLRYFEDLSEEETARTLGISAGTVKSQTHKALEILERHLSGLGEADDSAEADRAS